METILVLTVSPRNFMTLHANRSIRGQELRVRFGQIAIKFMLRILFEYSLNNAVKLSCRNQVDDVNVEEEAKIEIP